MITNQIMEEIYQSTDWVAEHIDNASLLVKFN